MNISFLIPGSEQDISGGHIYNRAIAQAINQGEHRCTIIYASSKDEFIEQLEKTHEVLLIDAWGLHDIEPHTLEQPFHLMVHHPLALDTTVEGDPEKENIFWNKAQSIIVTGEEVETYVRAKTKTPIHLVEPGIDVSFQRKSYPKYPKYLVGLGSFIERKGDLLLLDVLKLLPNEVVIHRYGPTFDKVFLQRLKTEIAQNNLEDRFIIHGEISHEEKLKVLQTADLMLFPSLYESYGMAIQESLAFGVPVLMSDLPHLRGRFGLHGVAYLPNEGAEWAKKIKNLLDKSQDYSYLCSTFTNYSTSWPVWGKQAQKIIKVFIALQ
jgi:glycosyltransferase involved in cell wall biosynthesis